MLSLANDDEFISSDDELTEDDETLSEQIKIGRKAAQDAMEKIKDDFISGNL